MYGVLPGEVLPAADRDINKPWLDFDADRPPSDALGFLRRNGNPFARLGRDETGRLGIEWGVYGLPETFLVGRGGIVRWRQVGAITEEILRRDLLPLLRRHA